MTTSIHSRILFSALIVLILFMGLTGIVLDKAFRNNVENSQQESLRTQIYTLLATAELDDNNQLQLPKEITEPRLNIRESDLHARITSENKKTIWQSKSMLNMSLPFALKEKIGEFSFSNYTHKNKYFTLLNFSTSWVTDKGEQAYTFQVAENKTVLDSQVALFRKNLWIWLAGVSIILMIVQTLILRWGLKPLRHVADDLLEIEKGEEKRLTGSYPKEINPLTLNLNQLLDSSEGQLTRYRDALGNMAHSLKTPITVLKGIIDSTPIKQKDTAIEQLNTINNIVDYQLQRASTVGRIQLGNSISLFPIANKILSALNKVYKDKQIETLIDIPSTFTIKVDEGDLYEMLGNLLENSYKWCNKKVSIRVKTSKTKIKIIIEDDGSGINKEQRERILLRGQRADQNTPGHGLGLAMVNDVLLLYKGTMEITDSSLGGAKIIIEI